jgi:membrane fusion protein, adhesin transport system
MNLFWFLSKNQKTAKQALSLEEHRGSRWLLWLTFITVGSFFLWAYLAEIDQITRAPGNIIASSRTQIIQSQDGGVLEELLVKEGSKVEAGDVLFRINRTRAEAAFMEIRAKAVALSATAARLRSEVFGGNPIFEREVDNYPGYKTNQLLLLKKRRDALNQELESLEKMRIYVVQELEMNLPLVTSGDVSRTEVLRLQRQIADLDAQINNKRNKYFQDAQAELSKAEEDLNGARQALAQKKDQLMQTEILAPVKGIVKNVQITTLGGVIRSGDEVMHIVPVDDDLVIEAKVSPADIAFLDLGQEANVKIDAYDFTVYGGMTGQLMFISADTLSERLRENEEPYYRVHVRIAKPTFSAKPDAKLEILPGMTGMVEIKTGRKTVLQYLTKPIVKTISESLGEK